MLSDVRPCWSVVTVPQSPIGNCVPGAGRHRLALDGEPGHGRTGRIGRRCLLVRGGPGLGADAGHRHVAAEDRDRGDVRGCARRRGLARVREGAVGDRARVDHRRRPPGRRRNRRRRPRPGARRPTASLLPAGRERPPGQRTHGRRSGRSRIGSPRQNLPTTQRRPRAQARLRPGDPRRPLWAIRAMPSTFRAVPPLKVRIIFR